MKEVRAWFAMIALMFVFVSMTCALARFGGGSIKWGYWSVAFVSIALMFSIANVISHIVETAHERPTKVKAPNYKYMRLKKKLQRDLAEFHDDPEVVQGIKTTFLMKAEQVGARMYAEDDFDEIFKYASRSH